MRKRDLPILASAASSSSARLISFILTTRIDRAQRDRNTAPLADSLQQNLLLHQGEGPPVYFWRDSRGHEVDFVVDLVSRRIPIEAKSGLTVAGDALDGLDRYLALSHDAGGLLVYGGDEARSRGRHQLRPSWSLSCLQ